MAPLEHHPMLADQDERPLFRTKLGAFLYAHLGPLGVAAERSENRHVRVDSKGVIAPMSGDHHPSVKVQDSRQLAAIEADNRAPVPGVRERRDDAQALFTFGCG